MREGGKQQAANPSRFLAFNEAQQQGLNVLLLPGHFRLENPGPCGP